MEHGFDPESFWDQTPRTLQIAFAGVEARLRREHNDRAWMVWHIEALARAKVLPALRTLQAREPRRQPQDWREMKAVAEQWATVLGGRIVKTKG